MLNAGMMTVSVGKDRAVDQHSRGHTRAHARDSDCTLATICDYEVDKVMLVPQLHSC
jgi:hypothetical protein